MNNNSYDEVSDYFQDFDLDALFEEGLVPKIHQRDAVIIIYSHCLPSQVAMLQYLCNTIGFDPQYIFFIAKPYSRIGSTALALRALGINVIDRVPFQYRPGHYDQAQYDFLYEAIAQISSRIKRSNRSLRAILVDDGGQLTKYWSKMGYNPKEEIVSIQQTTSGIYHTERLERVLRIDMARTAAKRYFESKIIATGVIRKFRTSDNLFARAASVIGSGFIGGAVAVELRKQGVPEIYLVDVASQKAKSVAHGIGGLACRTIPEALSRSSIVFGCTGAN